MLNEFGIINMRSAQRDAFITKWRKNGRLYDPLLGRFLSPDNYVQEPFNTQNLNRYSYCLNNPVKYTDPSGNFHLPSFLKFWKAAAVISVLANPIKHGFNFSEWDMHMFNRAVKITASTVQGSALQVVNKWTWNKHLTWWGHDFAQLLNMTGLVNDVSHLDGAVAISGVANKNEAFTFGHYIFGPNRFRADWRDHLFVHEYGHYVQAQRMGLLYIPVVAYPSVVNYGIGTIKIFGPSYHSERWYEVHASRLGAKHFDRHYGRGAVGYKEGDANYFDIKSFSEGTRSKYVNPRTGYVNNYVDYKNGINYYDPHIIHGHRHSLWDYLVPFTFFW
jgi:RHS repeat-associated protein